MAISATYSPASFQLTILGDTASNGITVSRNVAGNLLVNGGAVTITGGTPTVANTSLISAAGDLGNDTIALDEASGALPAAELYGGGGDDSLTGGSNGDTLAGEGDNDTLFGKGGIDLLYGGLGNDTLTGGDGDDQMYGDDGNDRMIWNPGDDSDLMEGGIGADIAEVNGGNGTEVFTITANGTRVRFDRLDPAPFFLDIGTTETLVLNANGGDDTISTSGNLAALITLTIDGGTGNDTILGSNGIDTLLGGDGIDFIDGNQGNDIAFLGAGADVFQWDPGDGSDVVEGQADIDTLLFNGSAANEIYNLSANGGRILLQRDVGAIVMDLNDVEAFTINALGGNDFVKVYDLTGTDASQVAVNLAATLGGVVGDGLGDSVAIDGTGGSDAITMTGSGTGYSISGLTATVTVSNSEGGNDNFALYGLSGNDSITATALPAGIILSLTLDGGAGADTILGSQGADLVLGGDGNDFVLGDNGNDIAILGAGNDVFEWSPGDGSDTIEGQGDFDELRFNGSNASETVNISPNGGRAMFNRDVASVTMDMDDVEKITFKALGGNDNVTVADMTGTDVTQVLVDLSASGGVVDLTVDRVTVTGSNLNDTIGVTLGLTVTGLAASTDLEAAEATDNLVILGNGGDDVIDASLVPGGVITLELQAGLGNDIVIGSGGGDLVNGGDGNDTALLGGGNDVFVWNPGDDNDIVEGQAGTDTLRFNGANIAETITIAPNGGRVLFFRDVAAVTMDLNDTEVIQYAALGGNDTITVGDLSGTDVTQIALDLASTPGGAAGDGLQDVVTLNASDGANTIALSGATGALLTATGLPATVTMSQFETNALDRLTVYGLGGNDTIDASGLVPHFNMLTIDAGPGNDTVTSNGDGTYLGSGGDDLILAGLTNSSEVLDGGTGIDTLDTRTWGGTYNINMVTGGTNYSGEAFTNFENLITGEGDDTITGTTGGNFISTNGGIDNINGDAGNDIVSGGGGADTLAGGSGFDIVDYRTSPAAVTINLATNSFTGGDATGDVNSGFEGAYGSDYSETLTGSAAADELRGMGGEDTIIGGAGADSLWGGTGNDVFFVDVAGDVVNELSGEGNDRVVANFTYALAAGSEVETLETNSVSGTTAINFTGSAFANTLLGNNGANNLDGQGGEDTLHGFAGNDYLYGSTGLDNMYGEAGDDRFYIAFDDGDRVWEFAGEGFDTVSTEVNYTLPDVAYVERLEAGTLSATTALYLGGSNVDNLIVGNAGNNTLRGFLGNDTLQGLGGDDVLIGDEGADVMYGGSGNDTFYVNTTDDRIFELSGEGSDRVATAVSFTLPNEAEIEVLEAINLTGTAIVELGGSLFANTITGDAGNNLIRGYGGNDTLNGYLGNDTLIGDEGNDTLSGGAGNDVYFVDSTNDVVIEAAGAGNDRVATSTSFFLDGGAEIETLETTSLTSTQALNLRGSNSNNVVIGNNGANVINGWFGNDTLHGAGGADIFAFTTALSAGNADTIGDFAHGTDKFGLGSAIFTAIAPGALNAGAFTTGAAAGDADDRIIYNSATGALYYDSDGTGAAAQVLFATISAGQALDGNDFMLL